MAPNRRLKQVRELRGWSQAKVAELIGTDATTVSRWERGLFLPTPYFREKLCELFNKNAEELGLLEATQSLHQQDIVGLSRDPDSLYSHTESGLSAQIGKPGRGEMVALKSRTLPEDVDTFTYILQRSSQEQQAYMLWEHAYVQALQDQRTEAQRLGQASVSVFEQVRHPNAAVVRAWLSEQGLLSASSPGLANSSLASAIHPKRSPRTWLRVGGAGVLVMLVLVGGLLLSSVASHRPDSSKRSDVNYAPQIVGGNNASSASHIVPPMIPQQPASAPVVDRTHTMPNPTQNSSGASIMPTISPSQLNPDNCSRKGSRYRCTIVLAVYGKAGEKFSWQASSTGVPVKFSSLQGTVSPGKILQEIVYIYAKCAQPGTLSFAFSPPSSTQATTVSVPWGC
ncbi:MAG: helix-turn-helix transcriptional regulator [Ktedonobacteraceae bacterium]|nr:helix-turn-helix transcriptional regulator [Ktedonobacteraceae bacterium]